MADAQRPHGCLAFVLVGAIVFLSLVALVLGLTYKEQRVVSESQISSPDSVAQRLGLLGTWFGRLDDAPSIVTINTGNKDLFSGVKSSGAYKVLFIGNIDETTRIINLRETKVIQGADWYLSPETGYVYPDTGYMSGTGKGARSTYSWSYYKVDVAADSVASRLGFTGIWNGTLNNKQTSLLIYSAKGNSFSGVKVRSGVEVLFRGTIDPTTHGLTIEEYSVVQGNNWSVGSETGQLSDDGKRITGKGRDKNSNYTWTYSKSISN
jgi:hypothetical protein